MMIQLNPALPLSTPKGDGIAHFLIDYGIEDELYWVVFLHATGECWTFANPEIRACKNIPLGRIIDKPSTQFSTVAKGMSHAVNKG